MLIYYLQIYRLFYMRIDIPVKIFRLTTLSNGQIQVYIRGMETGHYTPGSIYFFKVNNEDTKKMCKMCSKLIMTISDNTFRYWRQYLILKATFKITGCVSIYCQKRKENLKEGPSKEKVLNRENYTTWKKYVYDTN